MSKKEIAHQENTASTAFTAVKYEPEFKAFYNAFIAIQILK